MRQILQISILLVALLIGTVAEAQKSIPNAYLITASHDTIRGELLKESASKMLRVVQFGKDGKYQTYNAADIKGYGAGDSLRFESKNVLVDEKSHTVLLQVLVDGPTKLYYAQHLHASYLYFVQKQQGPVVPLHRSFYAGTLSSMLSDCEKINVQKYRYAVPSLSDLVHSYNSCLTGTQESRVLHTTTKIRTLWGIRASANLFELKYKSGSGPSGESFESTTGASVGIFVNIGPAGSKLSVQPELLYTSRRAESTSSLNHTRSIKLDAQYLQMPVLLKYKLSNGKLQPFFNAGPSFSMALSKEFKSVVTYDSGQTTTSDLKLDNYLLGVTAGAGIQTQLSKRNTLSLEARFLRDRDNTNNYFNKIYFDTWQLAAGFTF